jgi:hypothetical protein
MRYRLHYIAIASLSMHYMAACVVLLAVRPPLALVGDGHPNSHVMDANAG